jgi:hypothetical protein
MATPDLEALHHGVECGLEMLTPPRTGQHEHRHLFALANRANGPTPMVGTHAGAIYQRLGSVTRN